MNGAHFGPNFAGILLLCYPKLVLNSEIKKPSKAIYGFKISEMSPLRYPNAEINKPSLAIYGFKISELSPLHLGK